MSRLSWNNGILIAIMFFILNSCLISKFNVNFQEKKDSIKNFSNIELLFKEKKKLVVISEDNFYFPCNLSDQLNVDIFDRKYFRKIKKEKDSFFDLVLIENEKHEFREFGNWNYLFSSKDSIIMRSSNYFKNHCDDKPYKIIVNGEKKVKIEDLNLQYLRVRNTDKNVRLHLYYTDSITKFHAKSNWFKTDPNHDEKK